MLYLMVFDRIHDASEQDVQNQKQAHIIKDPAVYLTVDTEYLVFPTHRLYLGGPPRRINGRPSIFGETLFLLMHFFYPPEIMKPSAID